jgi:hypothetical protein
MSDPVLDKMATELQAALEAVGKDPSDPGRDDPAPAARAYAEYQRRGGKMYGNAEAFVTALVSKVVRQTHRT